VPGIYGKEEWVGIYLTKGIPLALWLDLNFNQLIVSSVPLPSSSTLYTVFYGGESINKNIEI
jgi:hypothetical protein